MFKNLKKKFAKVALVALALQLAFLGLGTGATGAYAADTTVPVGGALTLTTINHPAPAGIVTTPVGDVYTVTPALTGTDKLTSLNLVVLDDNLNTTPVPVFIDGVANGTMVYEINSWNYVPGTPVKFSEGTHNLSATFIDNYENSTRLSASFVTDETAPALATVTAVLGGVTQNKLAAQNLTAVVGQSVGAITATLTEDATLVSGTTGNITISGGTIPDGTPYGIFTVLDSNVLITPYLENAALGQIGTFTFTVAAGTIRDAAGNMNKKTTFGLVVTSPIVITAIGAIVGTPQVGQALTAGALTPALATATYKWQISATAGGVYTDILDATTNKYTVVAGDLGKFIRVVATGTGDYVSVATSAATTAIASLPVAPDSVTNLTPTFDALGHVTLTWVNPTTSYSKLVVYRLDGVIAQELAQGVTTYTDNTTELGLTYSYLVAVFDEAGNYNNGTPVSVRPVTIAAAVSDATTYVPIDTTNTDTNTDTGTDTSVKAEITNDTTNNDAKDDSGFPVWGIILLVILALVGGYLIWNQKPALEPIVTVETKKNNTRSTGSRSTTKKK